MRRCRLILLSLLISAPAGPAFADEFDTVNVVLSTSLTYDSNVFRLSDGADPQTVLGTSSKSDTISISAVTLRVDKSLSLQRFQLDVSETIYRYKNFSFLDFEGLDYRAAWLWHLTPRIRGTLGADRTEALVPFGDIRAAQQSVRVVEREYFTVEGQLFGGWHALAGASHLEQKDSRVALTPEQSYDAVSREAGIKYVAAPGTAFALIQRHVEGDYKNTVDPVRLIDDGFRENQTEFVGDWAATGKSTFRGRLARIDRHHEHFPQRDYDTWAGEVSFLWAATAKSRFNFLGRRDVATWWEPLSSYRVSDAATLAWTWQMSTQTALLVQLDRIHRDYKGPVVTPVGPLREDNERSAQLGLTWTPIRALLLRADLQHHSRTSNVAGNDFDANVANVSAAFTF